MASLRTHPTGSTPNAETQEQKKRRSSRACASCHYRKIRCDAIDVGFPCSKCRADGFDCIAHSRKKRMRKTDKTSTRRDHNESTPRVLNSIPEHVMLHKFPYYSFFRKFSPRGQPWLHARDPNHGVLLPVPMHDQSATYFRGDGTCLNEDVQFLKQKGALDLPPREMMDQFISDYFRLFHPFFPILDREAFLAWYRRSEEDDIISGGGPSLILLQAIIFTASSTVSSETIRALGFSSRKHARSALHNKVRYLYNLDYESDDITNIQALLLMSHYFPSMADQKHTWLWVHQAISLAQGAGLHQDSGPIPQRKLWARIWWACLIRDRLIALGTGRPMHINSLDCNVPPLTISDLEEDGDTKQDLAVKSIFIEFAKLCQYMEGVLSLPLATPEALPQQIDICERTLKHWLSHLCSDAKRPEAPFGDKAGNGTSALYRAVLHLMYNTLTIALLQSGRVLDRNNEINLRIPSLRMQQIADDSTQLAADLMRLDVKGCPTICVTSILPPLVIYLQLIRSSDIHLGDGRFKPHYQTCMQFLRQLGDVYWHANFYHDFFELTGSVSSSKSDTSRRSYAANSGSQSSLTRSQDVEDQPRVGISGANADNFDADNLTSNANSNGSSINPTQSQDFTTLMSAIGAQEVFQQVEDFEAGETLLPDDELFTDWLDNYAFFQNFFPSA